MTIGVFDGVHRGHRMLVERACAEAARRGVKSMVFTFQRHPLAVLAPAYCPPTLAQPDAKAALIEELGADLCLMLRFTRQIARIAPATFIEKILAGLCKARHVVCGRDFTFGAGGKGNVKLLQEKGAELGFEVDVCEAMLGGSSRISSTRVRQHLIEGDVAHAAEMLARRYGFEGKVVAGHQRGRTIGYPTANLEAPADQLIPADGVYAVIVRVGEEAHGGMLNVGTRPTFEGAGHAIETHLFDFSGDLLGQTIKVEFIDRVRDERKFSSVENLIDQLKKDEIRCRQICAAID